MGVLATYRERLRAKPRSYWLIGALVLAVTIAARPLLDARLKLDDLRNALFLVLTASPTNPALPRAIKLLPIGDAEFWGPEMAHRNPTNRAFLARLIAAADQADASVIALDFDLRLPDPDQAARPGDYDRIDPPYRDETNLLVRTIGAVAQHRRVILAKYLVPVGGRGEDTIFTAVPDVWGLYGLCLAPRADGTWHNPGTRTYKLTDVARRNIRCGYINLMDDSREVPPPTLLAGVAARIDAFPLAIARARDPAVAERFAQGHFYASYIPAATLASRDVAMSPSALFADPAAGREFLQHSPVLISAAWHLRARGAGERADVHQTPIGEVAGGLIHANIVEAVLDGRAYPSVSEAGMLVIEVVLGIAALLLFALAPSPLTATALLLAAMPVILLAQWLSLQLLGLFIDLFAPVVGLGVHAILDRLVGAHEHAA